MISYSLSLLFMCSISPLVLLMFLFSSATVEEAKTEEEGCPAAHHQRPAAPGRGGRRRVSAAGPAVFGKHTQQNGAEYGFTGTKPRGEK